MRNLIFTKPIFWLLAQAVLLLTLCVTADSFQLMPTDTDFYWETSYYFLNSNLHEFLTNIRTFGYPMLLRLVALVTPALDGLPFFHVTLRILGVFAFYAGLRAVGVRGWLALLMASPLLYANAILSHDSPMIRITRVLTDATGESMLILVVGFVLQVVGRPGRWPAWVGLTVSLFFAYQIRPANQYLVLLLPVLGVILLGMVAARADWRRLRLRVGLGLFAATVGPYLAWCLMRLVLVNHFGLVCFTGYQLCSLAGMFLRHETVPKLPEELRPYAEGVLARRDAIASGTLVSVYGPWVEPFDEYGRLVPGVTENDELYTLIGQELFHHVALEIYGDDPVLRDKKQAAMALAILKAEPQRYGQWIRATLYSLPGKVFWSNLLLYYLTLLLCGVALVWHLLWVACRVFRGPPAVAGRAAHLAGYASAFHVALIVGLAIAGSQGLLLSLIATTSWGSRYADAVGTMLIPAFVAALVSIVMHAGTLLGLSPPPAADVADAGEAR